MFTVLYSDDKPKQIDSDEFIAAMKSYDFEVVLDAFGRALLGALDHFKGAQINDVTLNAIRHTCAFVFRRVLTEYSVQLVFADGAVYVGAEPVANPTENAIALRWVLDFWPHARWTREDAYMPLGYHDEYDLYLDYIIPNSPRLLAKGGDDREKLFVLFPKSPATMDQFNLPGSAQTALRIAVSRAMLAGYKIF